MDARRRLRGRDLTVHLADMKRRSLILEFPYPQPKVHGYQFPAKPKILPEKINAGIQQAIDAGCAPTSRGRPFCFKVEDGVDCGLARGLID